MARRVWFAGTPRQLLSTPQGAGFTGPVLLPSAPVSMPLFPDVDPLWVNVSGTTYRRFPDPNRVREAKSNFNQGRAFALAPHTDWDFLDVFLDQDVSPIRLAPGMLVREKFTVLRVRPPSEILPPATRWVRGPNLQDTSVPVPTLPPNVGLVLTANGQQVEVKATGGATISFKKWNGNAWVAGTGPLLNVGDGVSFCTLAQQLVSSDVNGYRAVDISPDGVYSIADLYRGFGLNGQGQYVQPCTFGGRPANRQYSGAPMDNSLAAQQTIYVGSFTLDGNGNPGDPTSPTGNVYVSAFDLTGANGSLFTEFYARAILDVWDGEDAPCDYRPRLQPDRVIEFNSFSTVPAVGANNVPTSPIVTVPGFNVDAAIFQAVNELGSTGTLYAAIYQGSAFEECQGGFGGGGSSFYSVLASPIASQQNAGQALSCEAQLNAAAYLQVQVGATNATVTNIRAGSQLILRRKFCGG